MRTATIVLVAYLVCVVVAAFWRLLPQLRPTARKLIVAQQMFQVLAEVLTDHTGEYGPRHRRPGWVCTATSPPSGPLFTVTPSDVRVDV